MRLAPLPGTQAERLQAARQAQWDTEKSGYYCPPNPEASIDPPTGVHPQELSVHHGTHSLPSYSEPDETSDIWFRHSGWLPQRARNRSAIAKVFHSTSRLRRFDYCGADAWIMRAADNPNRLTVRADHCHDRFCTPCMTARGHIVANNLKALMIHPPYRLITLTVRGAGESLADRLQHLYKSFGRLRRTRLWREHVTGGVMVCEVTWSPPSRSWHPHLHLVCEGTYILKQTLSQAWYQATGDSMIVDLRLIRGGEACAGYVSKYVSKPLSQSYARDPDLLAEAVEALSHRRLCTTFGTWRGVPLYDTTSDVEWVNVERLSVVRTKANAGDADAIALMQRLYSSPEDFAHGPADPNLWHQ